MNDVEAHLISKGYRLINGQWFAPSRLPPSTGDKPDTRNEPVAKAPGTIADPVRRVCRITSYRLKLVDSDALWIKYAIDALRYAQILFDDTSKWLEVQVEQVKVADPRNERTEILIL